MYMNIAYLGETHEDIVNTTKPLMVTCCGYYKIQNSLFTTERPNGRGDYQLLYIASGKMHFIFDNEEKIIPKGNMILFRPKQVQMYYYYPNEKPEVYWVHFTGYDVENILDYYGMPKNENVFYAGTSADYQWLFRQLIQELQLRRVNYEEFLTINLKHIFLMINRFLKEGQKASSDVINIIEKATHYFNENYKEQINIEKYAESCHMSECWFINNFKKITKMTPRQYIVSLRITNAVNMLENTDCNISEIANAVGYDNSLYFSRLFHKYIGMSPTEYKNKYKQKILS